MSIFRFFALIPLTFCEALPRSLGLVFVEALGFTQDGPSSSQTIFA
jgi:hypothetical protein